jgi:hypothetical protein
MSERASSNAAFDQPALEPCRDPGVRPELRIPDGAAQTRMVSVARIRPDSRKSVRPFKGIICGHGTFALCNVKEGGIALCNEKASRPPRTQILVPPFFWRGFFFGPFSTTANSRRPLPHQVGRCAVQQDWPPMTEMSQTEKSRQRDGTAGLPSTPDIFDECRHGR